MNKDMTIKEFCNYHNACDEGREWALANCTSMQEVWRKAKPEWLLWIGTRSGVLPDRELRLFAVRCARSVQNLMEDARSAAALDVAERYANGAATDDELAAAMAAAWAAAMAAACVSCVSCAAWSAWSACAAHAACAAYDTACASRAAFAADMRKLSPNFEQLDRRTG